MHFSSWNDSAINLDRSVPVNLHNYIDMKQRQVYRIRFQSGEYLCNPLGMCINFTSFAVQIYQTKFDHHSHKTIKKTWHIPIKSVVLTVTHFFVCSIAFYSYKLFSANRGPSDASISTMASR
jgi:hypothetical protein